MKTLEIEFECVYSSYHLKLSFPHLVDAENLQIVLNDQKLIPP